MDNLKRVVNKDKEADLFGLLKAAVFEDHNIVEIDGVTWLIQSYTSEPKAEVTLIRLKSI